MDLLPRADAGSSLSGATVPRGRAAGPVVPCGSRPAARLLVVERRAVHVAGLTIRRAAEAQDGGVVDEAVGDGDGLSGRRQKLCPLLEGEI